jgi:hypothetical protein
MYHPMGAPIPRKTGERTSGIASAVIQVSYLDIAGNSFGPFPAYTVSIARSR